MHVFEGHDECYLHKEFPEQRLRHLLVQATDIDRGVLIPLGDGSRSHGLLGFDTGLQKNILSGKIFKINISHFHKRFQ